jgi:hypothetical protein
VTSNVDLNKLNTPKVINCNACGNDIKVITAKIERLTNNRIGYFFCCDRCGFKYPFAAITEKGQALLKKINRKKKDIKKFPELSKSLDFALRQDLKAYQNEVKDTYTEEEVISE